MFSCEFYELFRNTYFVEDLLTAGPQTPLRRSLFNKVASLMAWRPLTVLVRDSSTGILFLWILRNFYGSFFAENLLATTSHMFFFSFLQTSEFYSLKSICLVEQYGKLGEGIACLFNSVLLWKSGRNFIVKLRLHMYRLRHWKWKKRRNWKTC